MKTCVRSLLVLLSLSMNAWSQEYAPALALKDHVRIKASFTEDKPAVCPEGLRACAKTEDNTLYLYSQMPKTFGDTEIICDLGAAFLRELGMKEVKNPDWYRTRQPSQLMRLGPYLSQVQVHIHWGSIRGCPHKTQACATLATQENGIYHIWFPRLDANVKANHVCTLGHELLHTLGARHSDRD